MSLNHALADEADDGGIFNILKQDYIQLTFFHTNTHTVEYCILIDEVFYRIPS